MCRTPSPQTELSPSCPFTTVNISYTPAGAVASLFFYGWGPGGPGEGLSEQFSSGTGGSVSVLEEEARRGPWVDIYLLERGRSRRRITSTGQAPRALRGSPAPLFRCGNGRINNNNNNNNNLSKATWLLIGPELGRRPRIPEAGL